MKKYAFIISVLLIVFGKSAMAEGNLFISPQRLSLTEKTKIDQLHLVNKSSSTKVYQIRLVNYSMGPNGSLALSSELEHSAKDFLRYSPRRVTLEAGEDQYIRVMARMPRDLEDGGYHTHIEFNEVPTATGRGKSESEGNNASFKISAAYSVAIPIFVSKGETTAAVDLLTLEPKINADRKTGEALLKVARQGNGTAYNILKTEYIDADGNAHVASTPTRMSVYREQNEIERKIVLKLPDGVSFNGGNIRVSLHEVDSKTEGSPLDVVTAKVK